MDEQRGMEFGFRKTTADATIRRITLLIKHVVRRKQLPSYKLISARKTLEIYDTVKAINIIYRHSNIFINIILV